MGIPAQGERDRQRERGVDMITTVTGPTKETTTLLHRGTRQEHVREGRTHVGRARPKCLGRGLGKLACMPS
jgi:hypothetical protein